MKTNYLILLMITTVATLALAMPVPAFSQMMEKPMTGAGERPGRMMGMGHVERMGNMMGMCIQHAEMLSLSDDQIVKMRPMYRAMQKKQARFEADLKIAEIELIEIMEIKDFDMEKASAAVKKIGEIKTAHRLEMLKDMKEMRTILTDEQFKKMKKRMSAGPDGEKPEKMMKKQ